MTKQKQGVPTDYRKQRKKEDRNMVLLVMFVLIFVASGLIGVFFGLGALVGSLPCLGGGALLIGLIWAAFTLAERAAS